MTFSFDNLKLQQSLIEGLKKQNISEPTEIQIKTIPFLLENKDVIGESETGSGKTLAYLLPLFEKIDSSKKEMQSIILAPTHELAAQITEQIHLLSQNSGIPVTSAIIIGQVNIKRQIEKLKEKPHIIVGSTGRILELIKMKRLSAHTIKTIIVDEGDKLLDDNNISDVQAIIKSTMRDRQLMVFSATMNEKTINTASSLMKDAEVVKVAEKTIVNPNINHMYFICEQRDKIKVLRKLIASINPEKAIVFINKSEEIDLITGGLRFHHVNASGLYGTAQKEERKKGLDYFRSGRIQILVASDLFARGLDIEGVTHIINLDLPEELKEYLHRAGRTGRMGNPGTTISIVTKNEEALIKRYSREFNIDIPLKDMYKGTIVDAKTNIKSNKSGLKSTNKPNYKTSTKDRPNKKSENKPNNKPKKAATFKNKKQKNF